MKSLLLRRILAYMLDCAGLFVVLGPLGWLVQQAFGIAPDTAQEIYATLLLNFSVPVWIYFTLCDQSKLGATLGKRLLKIQVRTKRDERVDGGRVDGGRIGAARAFGRTAVKMLPWEMTHASAFLVVPAWGQFGVASWIGLGLAYALIFLYVIVAWRTGGHRSIHDLAADTAVRRMSASHARRETSATKRA